MEELIAFLRSECPEDVVEIQECVELLNQAIGGSVQSVKKIANKAIDERSYDKLSTIQQLLTTIDHIQGELERYAALLEIDGDLVETVEAEIDNDAEDKKNLPDYKDLQLDPEIPHTLYDSLTHKRPAGFEVLGKRYEATDWKSVLIRTCELLAATDKALFQSLTRDRTMQGRKIPYFVDDPSGMRSPREIEGTGVYLMTNLSANQIRNIIERMLRKYGIKVKDYKVYLRADYAARHE